jgi:hypothetical protein
MALPRSCCYWPDGWGEGGNFAGMFERLGEKYRLIVVETVRRAEVE